MTAHVAIPIIIKPCLIHNILISQSLTVQTVCYARQQTFCSVILTYLVPCYEPCLPFLFPFWRV